MLARALLVVALLAAPAAAETIGFRDAHATAPLSAWDLGRLRMYLESAATGCALAAKRDVDGDYPIALDLAASGKPTKVDVRGARPLARCLRGWLRGVGFPAAEAPYRFTAILRVGVGRELGIVVLRWHALTALHEHTVRNAILARLEDLPACARAAVADGVSVAIEAKLRAGTDGVLARPTIAPTTVASEALPGCLADHLAGLKLPESHTYTEVTMFFHLVQATAAPADGAVLMMGK